LASARDTIPQAGPSSGAGSAKSVAAICAAIVPPAKAGAPGDHLVEHGTHREQIVRASTLSPLSCSGAM
jgi:hypothetical protein